MHEGTWTLRPCPHEVQAELAATLGVSELTAGVLVRRGYEDPDEARAFLAGELPPHDPFLLGDMGTACERIRAAIAEGRRICVHGDYDVDGIAATALAVLLLRELGADVDWHLPSRSRASPTTAAASSSPSTAASPPSRRWQRPAPAGSR